jgi:hypothetical protein
MKAVTVPVASRLQLVSAEAEHTNRHRMPASTEMIRASNHPIPTSHPHDFKLAPVDGDTTIRSTKRMERAYAVGPRLGPGDAQAHPHPKGEGIGIVARGLGRDGRGRLPWASSPADQDPAGPSANPPVQLRVPPAASTPRTAAAHARQHGRGPGAESDCPRAPAIVARGSRGSLEPPRHPGSAEATQQLY